MGQVKEVNIKNWIYYFFNDMINLNDFYSSLLKIDKKSYKDIDMYYIGTSQSKNLMIMKNIHCIVFILLHNILKKKWW